MFAFRKQCTPSVEDHSDHQYYGAKLKSRCFESSSENHPSSTLEPDPEIIPYVEARQLSFQFKSSNPLLTNINLTVPKGKIYALLGASGCGKTTLLRIILGTYKPLSGSIKVNDKQPGTSESQIPGVGAGYMPQDLALFNSLTIEENLVYFGSLYGLNRSTIKIEVEQLILLLELPEKKRKLSQLSGGQKRLVSLAMSLIHRPPLLILDEPTVGVDPLLRQKIWKYLEDLCTQYETTVMLTTHYTEEAIDSYRVGFLYSGVMLAEDNPQTLLLRYQCTILEDVFLELCLEKEKSPISKESEVAVTKINSVAHHDLNRDEMKPTVSTSHSDCSKRRNIKSDIDNNQKKHNLPIRFSTFRLRAKLANHHHKFKRRIEPVIFFILVPTIVTTLSGILFVKNSVKVPVAVVNEEQNGSNQSLSMLFIEQIDQKALDLHYYNDLNDAINAIHSNQAEMVMRFPSNYSKYFRKRFLHPERVANNSNILLYADTSNALFYSYTYQTLLNAFENYTRSVADMLGYNHNIFGSAFQIQEPIYGTMSINYFGFLLPGFLIMHVHFICNMWSSIMLVEAKMQGFLERELVAGITIEEYLLSFLLLSLVPIIIMILAIIFILFFLFEATCNGSLWHLSIIILVTGLQGACLGLVQSVVARNWVEVTLLGPFIEFPLIFSCGCYWPIESIPERIRNILKWNPITFPIVSTQNIMFRGWSLMRFELLEALLYNIGFTILFLVFGSVYFRIFK